MRLYYLLTQSVKNTQEALNAIDLANKSFEKKYKRLPNLDFFICYRDSDEFLNNKIKKQIIDVTAYPHAEENISDEIEFFSLKKP